MRYHRNYHYWMSPECQASSPDHRFKYCSFHVPLFQPEITITNGQIDRFVQWHGLMVWNQLNDIQCRFCSIEAITWSKEVASTCKTIDVSLTTTKKPWANFRPHSWKCLRGISWSCFLLFESFEIKWQWHVLTSRTAFQKLAKILHAEHHLHPHFPIFSYIFLYFPMINQSIFHVFLCLSLKESARGKLHLAPVRPFARLPEPRRPSGARTAERPTQPEEWVPSGWQRRKRG